MIESSIQMRVIEKKSSKLWELVEIKRIICFVVCYEIAFENSWADAMNKIFWMVGLSDSLGNLNVGFDETNFGFDEIFAN